MSGPIVGKLAPFHVDELAESHAHLWVRTVLRGDSKSGPIVPVTRDRQRFGRGSPGRGVDLRALDERPELGAG
jgi:hypothetical protein